MDRSKIVAVVTGAIAIGLSLAYLLIVQLLDFRGEMVPAPIDPMGLVWPGTSVSLGHSEAATGVVSSPSLRSGGIHTVSTSV